LKSILKKDRTRKARHGIIPNLYVWYFPFIFSFLILLSPSKVLGYGYTKEEDPLLKSTKKAILYGKRGEWDRVAKEIKALSWQIEELKVDFHMDMGPILEKALKSKNMQKLAKALANLTYLALIQKFYWNAKEKLKRYVPAKARLYSAEIYYTEILHGNVRKYDHRNGTEFHREIMERFKAARWTLGSPGLFGVGARPPEPKRFKELALQIMERIEKVYPYFQVPSKIIE